MSRPPIPERQDGESESAYLERFVAWRSESDTSTAFDADLIPEDTPYEPSPDTAELDRALAGLTIIDAYNRWCRKMPANPGRRREGIKLRCPNPAHPDENPSAWFNLDKGEGGVGKCAVCGGFDKFDIFAWHAGWDVPGYKNRFPELRLAMAIDMGFTVSTSEGVTWATAPTATAAPETTPDDPEDDGTGPDAVVIPLHPADDDDDDEPLFGPSDEPRPAFDWRDIPAIGPDTFMHSWLTAMSTTTEPEEFHTWLGLQAASLATGNRVVLDDDPPIRSNLMLCLVGNPGTGKSRAIGRVEKLLDTAMRFQPEMGNVNPLLMSNVASGEALIDAFNMTATNPATEEKEPLPITGYVTDAEFSSLLGRSRRVGATLSQTMQEFYDSAGPVRSHSRTHGHQIARDHFANFVTTTQDHRLEDILNRGDETSGFVSRWIFAYGTSKPSRAIRTASIDMAPSIAALQKLRAWAAPGRLVRLDEGDPGFNVWEAFYEAHVRAIVDETTSATLARLSLTCRKLMLLFAINNRATTILPEHVTSLQVIWPYLLQSYGVIHHVVSLPRLERLMQRIERTVSTHYDQKDRWPTRRDIKRNLKEAEPREFDESMKYLLSDGRLIEEKVPTTARGGRPTTRYRLPTGSDGSRFRLP